MSDESRAIVEEQDDYIRQHPIISIWRKATTGSLTRQGGIVSSAISDGQVITSSGEFAGFTPDELDIIAGQYIHCSTNWNAIVADSDGFIRDGGDNLLIEPKNITTLSGDKLDTCKGITEHSQGYSYTKTTQDFIKGKTYPYGNW